MHNKNKTENNNKTHVLAICETMLNELTSENETSRKLTANIYYDFIFFSLRELTGDIYAYANVCIYNFLLIVCKFW